MNTTADVTLRDLSRVVLSGAAAYLSVHFLLLPQLVTWGVSFLAYFYIGAVATGFLSGLFSLLTRTQGARGPMRRESPTEHVAPRVRGMI